MCRDVYHCRPSEFRREAVQDVIGHLACLDVESQVRQMEHDAAMRDAGNGTTPAPKPARRLPGRKPKVSR